MKTPKRFDNAVDALVKGYFNNTLAKGNCYACAVGNIVVKANNGNYRKRSGALECENQALMKWGNIFYSNNGSQYVSPENYHEAKETIDKTGYTWPELAKVEYAFECNTIIYERNYKTYSKEEISQDQYNGLMAVVKTLMEIEGMEEKEFPVFQKMFEKETIK